MKSGSGSGVKVAREEDGEGEACELEYAIQGRDELIRSDRMEEEREATGEEGDRIAIT